MTDRITRHCKPQIVRFQGRSNSAGPHCLHFEPLEDRKMLATVYYNDDWVNVSNPGMAPEDGDTVSHPSDFGGIPSLTYGTDAFGRGGTGTNYGGELPFIHDAIVDDNVAAGDMLVIAAGTHKESDIVVNKPLTISGETGNLIVPELTSAGGTSDFGNGANP